MDFLTTSSSVKAFMAVFGVSFLVTLAICMIFQLIGRRTSFKSRKGFGARASAYLPLLVFLLSLLGAVVGIIGGWSRTGVVGDVIPAVLALIGGLTVYLFENSKGRGLLAIPGALAFAVAVFTGYLVGIEIRNPIERSVAYRDMCMKTFSNPDVLGSQDAYCRFLSGPGNHCWVELFENRMTYDTDARPGETAYEQAWQAVKQKRFSHMLDECQVRLDLLQKKLKDHYN